MFVCLFDFCLFVCLKLPLPFKLRIQNNEKIQLTHPYKWGGWVATLPIVVVCQLAYKHAFVQHNMLAVSPSDLCKCYGWCSTSLTRYGIGTGYTDVAGWFLSTECSKQPSVSARRWFLDYGIAYKPPGRYDRSPDQGRATARQGRYICQMGLRRRHETARRPVRGPVLTGQHGTHGTVQNHPTVAPLVSWTLHKRVALSCLHVCRTWQGCGKRYAECTTSWNPTDTEVGPYRFLWMAVGICKSLTGAL